MTKTPGASALPAMPAHVLFVVSIFHFHREVYPIVAAFVAAGWKVSVLVGFVGRLADDSERYYRELGCRVLRVDPRFAYGDIDELSHASSGEADTAGGPDTAATARRPKMSWARRLAEAFGVARPLIRLAGMVRNLRSMRQCRQSMAGILDALGPDVVFVGAFHSCGVFDNAIVVEARARHLIQCAYSFTPLVGGKVSRRSRFTNIACGMDMAAILAEYDGINRLMARLFPAWTHQRDGVTIFAWDPLRMLAARLAGLLERDVWQKPVAGLDAAFVFTGLSRRLLAESGYDMDKVVVAGIPLLDGIVRDSSDPAKRGALFAELGLADGEPFLLFNVEPSAEHKQLDWDSHWANFHAMMKAVTAAAGMKVVLSLHPLCHADDYRFAETRYGVKIADKRKIYELYPHCALSVSFACSTNVVAETFGKPLVIYDFFDQAGENSPRADEFRLPGVLVSDDPEKVAGLIRQVVAGLGITAGTPPVPQAACTTILRHTESLLRARRPSALSP